jgi:P4 family phage/plasmid primase-like protien
LIDFDAIRAQIRTRQFSQSDVGDVNLARCLLDDISACSGNVFPVSTRGSLYVYSPLSGVWDEMTRDQLLSLVQALDGVQVGYIKYLRDGTEEAYTKPMRLTAAKMRGVCDCALVNETALSPNFFEDAPPGIAFTNGFAVVSRDGIELRKRSPDNRALACAPFAYDADAEFPSWNKVLRDVFDGAIDGEDRKKAIQEFVGACLTGIATHYAKCMVFLGHGANGKSVIAESIAELLFQGEGVTYTTPQSWAGRFTLARLQSAKINIATELPDVELESSDTFKAVVDGGRVEVEQKNRDGYTMRPRAGHLFLANALPSTRDFSHGFWRRFLVVCFDRDFTRDPSMETKEAVKARVAKEAPGLMLWALHGAVRLLRQGRYTEPTSHSLRLRQWRTDVDAVASFVDECCAPDDQRTYLKEIHTAFREWCSMVGRTPISNVSLGLRLRALQIPSNRDKYGVYYALDILPRSDWAYGKVKGVTSENNPTSTLHQVQVTATVQEVAHG